MDQQTNSTTQQRTNHYLVVDLYLSMYLTCIQIYRPLFDYHALASSVICFTGSVDGGLHGAYVGCGYRMKGIT